MGSATLSGEKGKELCSRQGPTAGSAPRGDVTLEVLLCHVRPLWACPPALMARAFLSISPNLGRLTHASRPASSIAAHVIYSLPVLNSALWAASKGHRRPRGNEKKVANARGRGAGGAWRGEWRRCHPDLLRSHRPQLESVRGGCEVTSVAAGSDQKECGFRTESARHGKSPHSRFLEGPLSPTALHLDLLPLYPSSPLQHNTASQLWKLSEHRKMVRNNPYSVLCPASLSFHQPRRPFVVIRFPMRRHGWK